MINKLMGMIKRAFVPSVLDDTGVFPIVQVSYHDKIANVEHITPFGVYSNPPANALAVVMTVAGQEENRIAFINTPFIRFSGLKSGEVVFGSPVTGSYVKFNTNGDVTEIVKGSKVITIDGDFNITVNGDVNITAANANVTGTVSASVTAPAITLGSDGGSPDPLVRRSELQAYNNSHVHSNGNLGANTGAPTVPMPNSVGTTVVQGE